METMNIARFLAPFFAALMTFLAAGTGLVFAHCDTMDGPIIKNAQEALETGKIDLVLMWIQKDDEEELKHAFEKAREVRTLNPAARELADRYFIETFVRIHRAGEGAPFTGVKPAGAELNPAVAHADKALESGSADELLKLMAETAAHGTRERYERALHLKAHAGESVEAGRRYAEAYVDYVHYVEKLYDDAAPKAEDHGRGRPAAKHEH